MDVRAVGAVIQTAGCAVEMVDLLVVVCAGAARWTDDDLVVPVAVAGCGGLSGDTFSWCGCYRISRRHRVGLDTEDPAFVTSKVACGITQLRFQRSRKAATNASC